MIINAKQRKSTFNLRTIKKSENHPSSTKNSIPHLSDNSDMKEELPILYKYL